MCLGQRPTLLAALTVSGLLRLAALADERPRVKVERAERIEADLRDRREARHRDERQTQQALEKLAPEDPQAAEVGGKLLGASALLGGWHDDALNRAAKAYERLPDCTTAADRDAVRQKLLQALGECEQLEPLQDEVQSGLRKIVPRKAWDAAGPGQSDTPEAPGGDDGIPSVPEPVVVAQVHPTGPARFHPGGFCVRESLTYLRGLEVYARLRDLLGQPIDESFFRIRPPDEHRFERLKGLLDRLYDGGPAKTTSAYDQALSAVRDSLRAHADNCARILAHNRGKPVPPPESQRTPEAVERYHELADAYDREADALEAKRAQIETELQRRLEDLLRVGRGTVTPGAWPQLR
jgi:hypothetical protein